MLCSGYTAQGKYFVGLAINSSLYAAFLAFGHVFSPSTRGILERLM